MGFVGDFQVFFVVAIIEKGGILGPGIETSAFSMQSQIAPLA